MCGLSGKMYCTEGEDNEHCTCMEGTAFHQDHCANKVNVPDKRVV